MSEGVLTILKFCLLALLYLFLARVVWIVGAELRSAPATPKGPAPTPSARAGGRARSWQLVLVEPASAAATYAVDGDATIGRGGGCTISLGHDTFASQVHARVFDTDGKLSIEDLGSTNGTFVNGEPLATPGRLRKGDHVQVGETVFEVTR